MNTKALEKRIAALENAKNQADTPTMFFLDDGLLMTQTGKVSVSDGMQELPSRIKVFVGISYHDL